MEWILLCLWMLRTMDKTTNPVIIQGKVFKKLLGHYEVHQNGRLFQCEISSKLRKVLVYPTADPHSLRHIVRDVKEIEHTDPIAIGDRVEFIETEDGRGIIIQVLERDKKLTRRSALPSPGSHPFEQVIVANADQALPVFSAAQPPPKWNLLDRYLVSAEAAYLASMIIITKMDLLNADRRRALEKELLVYEKAGYHSIKTSVVTGEGLLECIDILRDRTSVLMGKSGVGKSSLLNALQPGLGLKVNEISEKTGKGKHTTTHLEMFSLEFGGQIVDTPGMREFGLWEIDGTDLALLFPEMRPYLGTCRYGLDCRHNNEPGCALKKAVEKGDIHPRRYQSYLRLRED
jgi:ribosome biogenesis GTPase